MKLETSPSDQSGVPKQKAIFLQLLTAVGPWPAPSTSSSGVSGAAATITLPPLPEVHLRDRECSTRAAREPSLSRPLRDRRPPP